MLERSADSPNAVTLPGSPPNARDLFCAFQVSAPIWSSSPRFPAAGSSAGVGEEAERAQAIVAGDQHASGPHERRRRTRVRRRSRS